jgi:hypothetical protein
MYKCWNFIIKYIFFIKQVNEKLGYPDCSSSTGAWPSGSSWYDDEIDFSQYDWDYYEYLWQQYEDYYADNNETTTMASSTSSTTASSIHSKRETKPPKKPQSVLRTINIPDLSVPKFPFLVLEVIINTFFTIDLALRLVSCPSLKRYLTSIINVLDAFALLSCYVHLLIVSIEKEYRYTESIWLNLLDFAQVFRALRLFRVVKNVRASKVLAYSLTQDLRDMTLLVMLLFVGISTFSCLIYFAESRVTIPSIPSAWYWAIVTMTTVGYGDISPLTGFGRVIASVCAICGVLLLAITLPMFVNNFLTLYQYSCVNDSIEKRKKLKNEQVDKGKAPVDDDVVVHDLDADSPPPAYEAPTERANNPDNVKKESTIFLVKEAVVT